MTRPVDHHPIRSLLTEAEWQQMRTDVEFCRITWPIGLEIKVMTTLEVLRGARERIARGWCQGHMAINSDGSACHVDYPSACCWCSFGAIVAASDWFREEHVAVPALCEANRIPCDIVSWNDDPGRTQNEVLAAFDRAIEAEADKEETNA